MEFRAARAARKWRENIGEEDFPKSADEYNSNPWLTCGQVLEKYQVSQYMTIAINEKELSRDLNFYLLQRTVWCLSGMHTKKKINTL